MVQVEEAKEKNAGLAAQKEDLNGKQIRLNAKLDELTSENRFFHHWVWESLAANRNLKSSLLEAERYREEYREVAEILALLKVIKNIKRCRLFFCCLFGTARSWTDWESWSSVVLKDTFVQRKKNEVAAEIKKTKEDLQRARMEGAMPKAKKYAPKFNKDTKVGYLDIKVFFHPGQPWHEYVDHPQLHKGGTGGVCS